MTAFQFTATSVPEELADCVKDSVVNIFGTMFGDSPQEKNQDDQPMGEGVVGIISFVGDVTWLMMVALPKQSAQNLSLKFAGFELDYDSPEMGDVVGEFANVLAGDIVARLGKEGVKVAMSLPTILRGQDVEPLLPRGIPSKRLTFQLNGDMIFVKVAGAREAYGRKPGT